MDDFKYAYFQKCAELQVPLNLEIFNLIRKESLGETTFKTLNLSNMSLTDRDMEPLIFALQKTNAVQSLILTNNNIRDLTPFEDLFNSNNTIEGIDLSENPFSDEASQSLITILSLKSNIKWFNITKKVPEKKPISTNNGKYHKKSESICAQKSTTSIPLPLSSTQIPKLPQIPQLKRPLPHKPKENAGSNTFRSNLYQGPHSARTWQTREDHENQHHVEMTSRLPERSPIEPEMTDRKFDDFEEEPILSVRPREKEIINSPIKNISMKNSPEKKQEVSEEQQITERIPETNSAERIFMSRTEWILKMKEIFENLVTEFEETLFHKALIMKRIKNESKDFKFMGLDTLNKLHFDKGYSMEQILDSIENSEESYLRYDDIIEIICNIDKVKPSQIPSIDSTSDSNINFLKEAPSQNNLTAPRHEYVECSFSIDNQGIGDSREILSTVLNQKKPPKFISKPKGPALPKKNIPGIAPHNFEIRHQIQASSPSAEIETARFNREAHQESMIKDKNNDSYKLEISSEISNLQEMGLYDNSISCDVGDVLNTINTTAKIMSAFGETPHNLSNLNTENLRFDKLALENNGNSFCISEKAEQSPALQGTLRQIFANKGFKPHEMDAYGIKLAVTEAQSKELGSHHSTMKIKKEDIFANIHLFEQILEQAKIEGDHSENKIYEGFEVDWTGQNPMITFSYNEFSKGVLPYSNLHFKNLLKFIEAMKLVTNTSNLCSKLSPNLNPLNIKVLNLSYNNLVNADLLENFTNLEFLNLSHNKLKALPALVHCTKLKEVYFGNNKFIQLPNFFGLDKITLISAPNNLITSLENIANLTLNKKLQILDLSDNPVTNKQNYTALVKNILPQLIIIDNSDIDLSEYKHIEDLCFTKDSEIPRKSPHKSPYKENNNHPLMSHRHGHHNNNSQMSMVLSESERSDNQHSTAKKKKPKSQVPKLNIENIQPLDFSSLKSGSTQKKALKIDIRFNNKGGNEITNREEKKLISERMPVVHPPSASKTSENQFRRKKESGASTNRSNVSNMHFLSQREHIPFKLMASGSGQEMKNFIKSSNRYPENNQNNSKQGSKPVVIQQKKSLFEEIFAEEFGMERLLHHDRHDRKSKVLEEIYDNPEHKNRDARKSAKH